jgi:hypothetical protein
MAVPSRATTPRRIQLQIVGHQPVAHAHPPELLVDSVAARSTAGADEAALSTPPPITPQTAVIFY